MKLIATETEEHLSFMEWASTQKEIRDVIIHIANERKCSWKQGQLLKRMGVRKGVSDFFIPIPAGQYHGLWIELKRANAAYSTVTNAQIDWVNKMTDQGYWAQVAFGWEQARKLVILYLDHERFFKHNEGEIKC